MKWLALALSQAGAEDTGGGRESGRCGHRSQRVITPMGTYSGAMGNGEAVMRDAKRGVHFGASDPRTDGAAIPEQPAVPAHTGRR